MNKVLIFELITILNIIFAVSLLILQIWRSYLGKKLSLTSLVLNFAILVLLILQMLKTFEILTFVISTMLVWVLVLIIQQPKSDIQEKPINDTLLIEQAREQERSRIYANLHDDVGAKLLELIYSAPNEETKSTAKEIMSKIRNAVATTTNIQCSVSQLANELHAETKLRLESAGIKLEFESIFENHKRSLSNQIPATISRIVRELVNNVIKHSKASMARLIFSETNDGITIVLEDNGIGILKTNHGKGLSTIEKRVKSINAEILCESQRNKGTSYTLKYQYDAIHSNH